MCHDENICIREIRSTYLKAKLNVGFLSLSFKRVRLPPPVQDINRKSIVPISNGLFEFQRAFGINNAPVSKTKTNCCEPILEVLPKLLTSEYCLCSLCTSITMTMLVQRAACKSASFLGLFAGVVCVQAKPQARARIS